MPRFWVLTDHSRGQVVLVIRGVLHSPLILNIDICVYHDTE